MGGDPYPAAMFGGMGGDDFGGMGGGFGGDDFAAFVEQHGPSLESFVSQDASSLPQFGEEREAVDNIFEYQVFCDAGEPTASGGAASPAPAEELERVRASIMSRQAKLVGHHRHLWHADPLQLEVMRTVGDGSATPPPPPPSGVATAGPIPVAVATAAVAAAADTHHLSGMSRFGDSVDDEWLMVGEGSSRSPPLRRRTRRDPQPQPEPRNLNPDAKPNRNPW